MTAPNWKQKTPRDDAYLAFIRTFPCCVCGWPAELGVDAHHIETGGASLKCSDYLTVPLCRAPPAGRGCHPKADKGKDSAERFRPVAVRFNRMWVSRGHKLKE